LYELFLPFRIKTDNLAVKKKEPVYRNVTFARADLSPYELAAIHTDGWWHARDADKE